MTLRTMREVREYLMEWWRRVMGAEDIVRGIEGFVEMETEVELECEKV